LAHEIALFWLVLAGLLFFDNLVLVPAGGDHLRFGRKGRLRYDPRSRLEARHRDLILLNPLNPFDRIALTRRCIGKLTPVQWRSSVRLVKDSLGAANRLSMLGSIYLLMLGLLAVASMKLYFGSVLLALSAAHLSTWLLALWVLVRDRKALQLSTSRASALAVEAMLVPGYLVNLGKRVWLKHELDIPGLTLGLRQLKRMSPCEDQELYHLRLTQRLDEVALAMDLAEDPGRTKTTEGAGTSTEEGSAQEVRAGQGAEAASFCHLTLREWLQDARQCLTTSAPAAGS